MAIEVGAAYVSILPSAKGFSASLKNLIGKDADQAGAKAGVDFGTNFTRGAQDKVDGRGIQDKVDKGVDARGAGTRAGREYGNSMGTAVKGAVKTAMAGVGAGLAVAGIGDFITSIRDAASETQQSTGAIASVFNSNTAQIEASAQRAAQSVGLSANEYRNLAAVLGSSLKNKGIDDFANQTEGLIALGADLSSMYGGTSKQAVEALGSALRGETDPIERYGISLNQAAIEAEATKMGMQKVNGEFTAQQKAMATLQVIQKQSADAQGNFNREQDTYAGKSQRAAAAAEDLRAKLGDFLLPLFTDLAGKVGNDVVPAISRFVDEFKAGTGAGGQFKDILTTVKDVLSGTIGFVRDNSTAIGILTTAILGGVAAYRAMQLATVAYNAISTVFKLVTGQATASQLGLNTAMLANPMGILVVAIGALVAALVYLYNNNETVKNAIDTAWAVIKGAISSVVNWITGTAAPRVVDAWNTIQSGLETVRDGIGRTWESIQDKVKEPIKFVVNTVIRDGIVSAWNSVASKLSLPTWDFGGVSFDTGGWTGPGSKYQPAGIVHADEFVIRKESQQRLSRTYPGLLDYMNVYGAIPGYAGGGLATWANMAEWARRYLPGMTLTSGMRSSNDFHGAGKAIDLAAPMNEQGKAAMLAAARVIAGTFGGSILELIHTPAGPDLQLKRGRPIDYGAGTLGQHYNHVHWAMESFTEEMLNAAKPGEGGFSLSNPIAEGLKALISAPFNLAKSGIDRIGGMFGDSEWVKMATAFAKKPVESVQKFISDTIERIFPPITFGGGAGGEGFSGNVGGFGGLVSQALSMLGQPQSLVGTVLRRMNQESGGNPNAVNQWDINAANGTPSKGLMQVIDPTFRAYAMPGYASNIYDPLSNILASMRYALARYGSLSSAYDRPGGYAHGGLVQGPFLFDGGGYMPPGLSLVANHTGRPERVLTEAQEKALMSGGDTYNISTVDRDNVDELVRALNHASRAARLTRRYVGSV